MFLKRQKIKFLTVLMIMMSSVTAFADSINTENSDLINSNQRGNYHNWKTWGAQEGSYSPDWGRIRVYSYSSGSQKKASPKVEMKLNSSNISSIKKYASQSTPLFYTLDVSGVDASSTTLDAYNNFYTNIPNAKFDIDNDKGGGAEETEVTCLSPSSLKAGTVYKFAPYYKVSRIKPEVLAVTSQMSYKSPLSSEYNAKWNDEHTTYIYQWRAD